MTSRVDSSFSASVAITSSPVDSIGYLKVWDSINGTQGLSTSVQKKRASCYAGPPYPASLPGLGGHYEAAPLLHDFPPTLHNVTPPVGVFNSRANLVTQGHFRQFPVYRVVSAPVPES